MSRTMLLTPIVFVVACGGTVAPETAATHDSGSSSDAVGTIGSDGGGSVCPTASASLKVDVAYARAGSTTPATGSIEGMVMSVSRDVVELDACHPAADCVPMLIRVSLGRPASDLGAVVAVKGFVRLDWERSPTGWAGDTWRVAMHSVATWGGMANPTKEGDAFLFAASSGRLDTLPGTPFTVTKSALDCPPTETTSTCAWSKAYTFDVASPGQPTARVGMGQRVVTGGLAFENLEAWDSKCTDDYWHWSWVATRSR